MKKTKWFFGTLSLLLAVALLAISFSFPVADQLSYASEKTVQDAPPYEYQQTKDLVSLVDEAAALIEKEGEKAFPTFRKKGSKWFHGDLYVFVWDVNGMRVVYPRDPEGEGKNMRHLKDIDGRPIGDMLIGKANGKTGQGWIFYKWSKPGQTTVTWKGSFVKRAEAPSGTTYLAGSGLYDLKIEKAFIFETVNAAANLLKKEGKKAFAAFSSKTGEFMYLDTYVFIKDMDGNELLNPAFPHFEGKNISDLKDVNGKYFIREELEILKTQDACWMEYMWPKPGQKRPSKKRVYVKKVSVSQETLVVGAGYFPDE